MLRLSLAWVHLLALGVGLGAVWSRAANLSGNPDIAAIRRALAADAWWGIAAGVWIFSGVWRLIGETEKDVSYYMSNNMFFAKMGFLALVLVLEIRPMITLIGWRRRLATNPAMDVSAWTATAAKISKISYVQCLVVIAMVLAAVGMARGFG